MQSINPILVRDRHDNAEEILLDVDYSTVSISKTVNSDNQLTLTVYKTSDGLFSYSLLKNKNYVIYNGQTYFIEQCNPSSTDGKTSKAITALHIYFGCRQIKIRKINAGKKTYSAADIMHFAFDDNTLGYTWELKGNFPNIEIENLGNLTALDIINTYLIERQYGYVKADNRHITICDEEHFKTNGDRSLNYFGDTSDVKATFDTSGLVNQVQCYGKPKDDKDGEYEVSFLYTDQESVESYGVWPGDDISDERFTDQNSMTDYVKKSLQAQPAVTLQSNYYNPDPIELGDTLFLNAVPLDFTTDVFVTVISGTPFTSDPLTITYNNTPKTILDMQIQLSKSVDRFKNLSNPTRVPGSDNNNGSATDYTWNEKDVTDYYGK